MNGFRSFREEFLVHGPSGRVTLIIVLSVRLFVRLSVGLYSDFLRNYWPDLNEFWISGIYLLIVVSFREWASCAYSGRNGAQKTRLYHSNLLKLFIRHNSPVHNSHSYVAQSWAREPGSVAACTLI